MLLIITLGHSKAETIALLELANGEKYSDVTISGTSAKGLKITHKTGAATIRMDLLPANLKEKYSASYATQVEKEKQAAAKDISQGFTNSLGMKFVPVTGTEVLFCIHETRGKDYAAFWTSKGTSYVPKGNDTEAWRTSIVKVRISALEIDVPIGRGKDERAEDSEHPVSVVSWNDATAFCKWLSEKEGRKYRLPTDREWSVAAEINQESFGSPGELTNKLKDPYKVRGNWADKTASEVFGWPPESSKSSNNAFKKLQTGFRKADLNNYTIDGYSDGYPTTAPVMSFAANKFGIFDLEGNVIELCAGFYGGGDKFGEDFALHRDEQSPIKFDRVTRGGSWRCCSDNLIPSRRTVASPNSRLYETGFRCVVVR